MSLPVDSGYYHNKAHVCIPEWAYSLIRMTARLWKSESKSRRQFAAKCK